MPSTNLRRTERLTVDMNLRSTSLPSYRATILDLSKSGARIQLRGAVTQALEHQRIRFGASLVGQMNPHFQGLARVAWVKETNKGWQAGLEWEKLSPSDWQIASLVATKG